MYHYDFELQWAHYWIDKYIQKHEPKKAKLLQQLVGIQETLGQKSILDTSILISGYYSYDELKSVIEYDMDYHLVYPKDKLEHDNQRIFLKFLKRKKFIIKIL